MSTYIAIDLKSFYASVECVERGFDPLKTNLVVADEERTEKTICLAVSPSLKAYGISGRARLFEVVSKVKEINNKRLFKAPLHRFSGDSYYDDEVKNNPSLALNYYIAKPRMNYYMKYSSKIYEIYLKYVSKDDIHVYSIDEVFIDVSKYLNIYKISARELAMRMIKDVLNTTGITATCGIGPNLYLAKVAMDIVAKRIQEDKDGVRIAEINEKEYRRLLWEHEPLTDFWRIGKGISKKLNDNGMYCMGDVARMSIKNEDLLYKLFGINAELLIDHAWGIEPVTIKEIKAYKPQSNSLSSGQVLKEPYPYKKAKLIVKEMSDALSLDLVKKGYVTNQIVLTIVYDSSNDLDVEYTKDVYGRKIPKNAHGSINLDFYTSSTKIVMSKTLELFDRIINSKLTIRRVYIVANNLKKESEVKNVVINEQMNLFSNYEEIDRTREKNKQALKKERKVQEAILKIQEKYGKNALIKANSLEEGATSIERNKMVGGHNA